MDRTMNLRAYNGDAKNAAAPSPRVDDTNKQSELTKLSTALEDERSKSLELLKEIVQLRESLKREQTRAADLESKLIKLASVEDNQLAKKNAQIEEEKRLSLEYMRTIEQLRETIRQDQARTAEMAGKASELEAKTRAVAEL